MSAKTLIIIRPKDRARISQSAPASLSGFGKLENAEVWFINDGFPSFSAEAIHQVIPASSIKTRVIDNEFRYGLGGVQKVAMRHAIENGFDSLLMIEAFEKTIGQVAAKLMAELDLDPSADAVLLQNRNWPIRWLFNSFLRILSGTNIRGIQSLYRGYRISALKKIAFDFNTFEDHFDTEILLQLDNAQARVKLVRPDFKIKNVGHNLRRAINDLKTSVKFRFQKAGFFFDLRFHPEFFGEHTHHEAAKEYESKFDDFSPHSLIQDHADLVPNGSKVLDIGCSTGYVSSNLASKKNCRVTGIDMLPEGKVHHKNFEYVQIDLESGARRVADLIQKDNFDVVIMLDVLEHLSNPEFFLLELFKRRYKKPPMFIFSTANVAFIGVRLMLLLGHFNYGDKGILDITHKRLFAHRTFKNLMEQTGFHIRRQFFFPLPFNKINPNSIWSKVFGFLNRFMIKIWPTAFSYQILFEARLLASPVFSEK